MTTYYTLLTKAGEAKFANAAATNTAINLSHIAVGDGNGAAVAPPTEDSVMVNQVYQGALASLNTHETNPNWLVAEMVIPADQGGWTIREVALKTSDGTTVAYGNFPASYKPLLAEGSAKELLVRFYLETSSSAQVTLQIDPAVVMATREFATGEARKYARISRPKMFYLGQL